MKEILRHPNLGKVVLLQSVLEDAGIATFVRNANTQQAMAGDLLTALFPIPEFWPALCVLDEDDFPQAVEILELGTLSGDTSQPDWTCPRCGTGVPGNFGMCWKCGGEDHS